jgi:hypothetical protein
MSYELLVSFPDQSESYVLGFEAGQLWEVLKAGNGDMVYLVTMHTANEEAFTRIGRHYGCTVEFVRLDGGWSEATVLRSRKPKLTVVPSPEMSAVKEKTACRCPTDWCRLEPDNGAEYCPDLGPNEFCAQRD